MTTFIVYPNSTKKAYKSALESLLTTMLDPFAAIETELRGIPPSYTRYTVVLLQTNILGTPAFLHAIKNP